MNNQPFNIVVAHNHEADFLMLQEALSCHINFTNITKVADGHELLSYAKTSPHPDVIFLDVNLKHGKECLEKMWKAHYVDNVPVVMYSNTHNPTDVDFSYKMGASYYLVKPNSSNSLAELLNNLITMLENGWRDFISMREFVLSI